MNCLRHKIKNQSPLGKRANPRVSRICQILSPLGFFDPSASRIRSRIPLGLALGPPRFSARTPLVTLSDTLVRPSDARWDLENPRGLKSAEMEPCARFIDDIISRGRRPDETNRTRFSVSSLAFAIWHSAIRLFAL